MYQPHVIDDSVGKVGQGNLPTFSDNTGTVGNSECSGGGNYVEK